ncbi:hypothetical protein BN6_12300 [Saccharothrix espanaensis DSM 44229]|uniref:Uncharacterized protein n=1 Tax=Saccharothrix espanaensis (strain ATCC 51144 / DSM 44229 / JCM 9112 / NBRC 15066 / NRRL 15764) TaxID=1179773 RepID=K0JRY5_SACES|nr:hypothetical protein BN6_12300 [Saccharothrix espanaensis DSM 44229]
MSRGWAALGPEIGCRDGFAPLPSSDHNGQTTKINTMAYPWKTTSNDQGYPSIAANFASGYRC